MKHFTLTVSKALGVGMLFLAGSATMAAGAAAVGSAAAPAPSPATATNKPTYTVSLGTELMAGDTTYQIGYPATSPAGVTYDGYFPFSELEWPLDIWLAVLDGSVLINDQWRINATLKKDLSTPSDNMIDSDWITPSNPDRLDVYSESEISSFDAFIMDVGIDWTFMKRDAVSFYG